MFKDKKAGLVVAGVVTILFLIGIVGFLFTGCGDSSNLSKEDYKKAFDSAANALVVENTSSESNNLVNIYSADNFTDEDFVPVENDTEISTARNMLKFLSAIMDNKDFELQNGNFTFSIKNVDNYGTNCEFIMNFDYKNQTVYAQVLMADSLTETNFYQYIEYKINYDFINDRLIEFDVINLMNGGIKSFNYCTFDQNNGVRMLVNHTIEFKAEQDFADVVNQAVITGENITNVYASQQKNTDNSIEYGVIIEFDAEGTQALYELTSQNIDGQIYIYIDGELFSAPSVNYAISGGNVFISGGMDSYEDAVLFAQQIEKAVSYSTTEKDAFSQSTKFLNENKITTNYDFTAEYNAVMGVQ